MTLDTMIIFILFFSSLLFSIYHDISIIYSLLLGLLGFSLLSLRRGYTLTNLFNMMVLGSKKSLIVIKIFVLIGAITAVWRASGTISFIVYYAIALVSAKYFILSAFLLCCLVSFLLGTSFGTVGTIGVVLMVLAKGGNVDINMTAGAIIAGAYFGDRCSPMSSSANLIASLTDTKLYINIHNMMKTSILPFIISIAGYTYLSNVNPLSFYDTQMTDEILKSFDISIITLLPAAIILLLAAFRIDVKLSMGISILSGILIGLFVQHLSFSQMATYIMTGYTMEQGGFFANIIQGGGLYSMLKVALIVLISSSYSGIFEGTGLLQPIEHFFERLSAKISVFPTTILSSIATAAFSCNQTLAVMLTHQFAYKIYEKEQRNKYQLALDMENTVILLSAVIPWNIAGAVPAAALATDSAFIPYAFYLFLVPLVNLFFSYKVNTSTTNSNLTSK